MPSMSAIKLVKPLKSVKIGSGVSGEVSFDEGHRVEPMVFGNQADLDADVSLQELEIQKHLYQDSCAVLQDITAKLNQLCDDMIAGHHEAIARLSIEIARKVIMRNVEDGDYQIESIIREALKNSPKSTDMIIRLNPRDMADLQELQEAGQTTLSGFELEADPGLGRAECVLESSKGVIKVLIDEQLEQINKALSKTG